MRRSSPKPLGRLGEEGQERCFAVLVYRFRIVRQGRAGLFPFASGQSQKLEVAHGGGELGGVAPVPHGLARGFGGQVVVVFVEPGIQFPLPFQARRPGGFIRLGLHNDGETISHSLCRNEQRQSNH